MTDGEGLETVERLEVEKTVVVKITELETKEVVVVLG